MLNKKYFYLDEAVAFLTFQIGYFFSQDNLIDRALQNQLLLFISASNWQVKYNNRDPFRFDKYCPIDSCTLKSAIQTDRKKSGESSFVNDFPIKTTELVQYGIFSESDIINLKSVTPTSCPFTSTDLVIKYDALLEIIDLYRPITPVVVIAQTNPSMVLSYDELFSENLPLLPDTETSCSASALTDVVTKQEASLDSIGHEYVTKLAESVAPKDIIELVPAEKPLSTNMFRKNKTGTWDFKFNGQGFPALPDRIGFSYIQQLLQNPHRDICANVLSSLLSKTVEIYEPEAISALIDAGLSVTKSSNAGQCIDSVAIKQYKMRMEELKDLIEEACESDDIETAENYKEEFDLLANELKQNTNLKGKPKIAKSDARKISQAVSRSIKNAINEITPQCPDLAEHLTAYINKGKACEYKPPLSTEWSF